MVKTNIATKTERKREKGTGKRQSKKTQNVSNGNSDFNFYPF